MALLIRFHTAEPGDMAYAVCAVFACGDGRVHVSNGWTLARSRNAAIARHTATVRRDTPGLGRLLLSQAVEAAEHPASSDFQLPSSDH